MAKKNEKSIEVAKQEVIETNDMERTRAYSCFVPKTDIYEQGEDIYLIVNMPGVNRNSVDIMLEKNVLTINGYTTPRDYKGYTLAYSEYEPGDYQRSFQISDEIDRDKIEAIVTNGELKLRLPKAEAIKAKKIPILAS